MKIFKWILEQMANGLIIGGFASLVVPITHKLFERWVLK